MQLIKNTFLLILISGVLGACNSTSDEEAIHQVFEEYQAALIVQDGETAIKYINQPTIGYYDEMLELAKSGSKEEIQEMSIVDQVAVLSARVKFTPEQLEAFTPENFVIYSINEGMIGSQSAARFKFDRVAQIEGNKAAAIIGQEGAGEQKGPLSEFQFTKEDGQWKLDLIALLNNSKLIVEQLAARQQIEKQDMVERIVLVNNKIDSLPAGIWKEDELLIE